MEKPKLTKRELTVLSHREAGKTQKEIGILVTNLSTGEPLSKERIRQIEKKALRRLREISIWETEHAQ